MEGNDLYRDIAQRTDGDIYIGVVGPVRTGKSTFIKRMMDVLILPNIENNYRRERVVDELPQSGAGRTIMTTQPKFVPDEAVEVLMGENIYFKARMVDCVGYMVRGALGFLENEAPRMVRTPWFAEDIPFEEAAEIGTQKVMKDHSTIGVLMTTDGTITELPRNVYIEAEERVVSELKSLNKPFVVILNSLRPQSAEAQELCVSLQEKYQVPVLCVNVQTMELGEIHMILEKILYEFPLSAMEIHLPGWMEALEEEHWIVQHALERVREALPRMEKVRDAVQLTRVLGESEFMEPLCIEQVLLGQGRVVCNWQAQQSMFYRILGEECGCEITGDQQLIQMIKQLSVAKREYDRIAGALQSVRDTGYGMVPPTLEEMVLAEPEIVRQGNRFGVRLQASAPSLHLMRVDIETEVSPIVGTEKQSEEMIRYLLEEFENSPEDIWDTNFFGKSLHDMVKEGLSNKLMRMPEDAQMKIQETIQRIINEGSTGLICILL